MHVNVSGLHCEDISIFRPERAQVDGDEADDIDVTNDVEVAPEFADCVSMSSCSENC